MTDKLTSHERAKRSVQNLYDPSNNSEKYCVELVDYISQQEQFAKDVARYFEDRNRFKNTLISSEELAEFWALEEKLSKVGKEE